MNLITWIRESEGFKKTTTAVMVFFFLFTFYSPSVLAVKQAMEKKPHAAYQAEGRTDEEKLSNTLQVFKERVSERKNHLAQRIQQESSLWQDFLNLFGRSDLSAEDLEELSELNREVQALHQSALKNFDEIEKDLKQKELPAEILQRHHEAVARYKAEYQNFQEYLRRCMNTQSLQDQRAAMEQLDGFLQQQQFKRSQQPFDPDKLPFGTPDPAATRQPVTDPKELNKLLGLAEPPRILEQAIDGLIAPAYAQTGNPPTAADLQATIDVQITPAIQQKAAELNHDPVRIYNWVRNTIEFLPTYGSIQGSQATLDNRKGNAFDTASLLIALLRASNIPARYAYGTVRIPAEQVMNWVGGVEVPQAALSILGQGGIPAIGLAQGGRITHIRMEHIWVEAWVDFEPSRGAKNIQGDTWIPLDASFKQYDYTDGIDIQNSVQFDFEAYAQGILENALVNEQAGYISNVSEAQLLSDIQPFLDQINQLAIDNNVQSLADLVGGKVIIPNDNQQLNAGLPYELVFSNTRFSSIPDNFRHKFKYDLLRNGAPIISVTKSTPELAGKEMALSFAAATQQDADTIEKIFAQSNGRPTSFPGYLVNVKAELTLDGEVLGSAGNFSMGTELSSSAGYWIPGRGWKTSQNNLSAGEYYAIGLDLQGVSKQQLDSFVSTMGQVKARLESGDLTGLTRHSILGKILHSNLLGYYSANDDLDNMLSNPAGVVSYRLPSYGFFFSEINPQYFFGIPRNLTFPGMTMDIDSLSSIVTNKRNDADARVKFSQFSGLYASYFENAVPERLLTTPGRTVQGVSAAKALALANAAGQRIYSINQSNVSLVLPGLRLDAQIKRDIVNAVNAGKIVYTHHENITLGNWTGAGYIVLDAATGSGAYLISGGFGGGANDFDWTDFARLIGGALSFIATAIDALASSIFVYFACSGASGVAVVFATLFVVLAIASLLYGLLIALLVFTSAAAKVIVSLLAGLAAAVFFKAAESGCSR